MSDMLRRLVNRLKRVEREKVSWCQAVVTDNSPLTVKLAGSDTEILVQGIDGLGYDVNAVVTVLVRDADMLALGASTGSPGGLVTYAAGDGLDLSSGIFSVDLKTGGGLKIESTELAADFGTTSGKVAEGSALAAKADLASPTFTGDPKAPTPSTGDNDTSIATTAFVKAQAYATLASPTFTGDPKAPTPSTSDNDTSLATTAFVKAQKVTDLTAPTSSFSMNGQQITNSADATTDTGLVTYQQMLSGDEAAASGYPPLPDVDYVARSQFLSAGWGDALYGIRSGNVITATDNGVLRIAEEDWSFFGGGTLGFTPQVGETLLLPNQQNFVGFGSEVDNGIYEVTSTGSVSTPYVLTRRADANTTGELQQFNRVRSRNGGLEYYLSSATPTINTDDQDWVEYRRIDALLRARLEESGLGVVVHGASTSEARPLGYEQVLWVGSATPSNREADDPWLQSAAPEAWIEVGSGGSAPAFANSWVNYTGVGANTAAFYKDPFGIVRLKGLIRNGTVGSGAFTLPTGYRPAATLFLSTISNAAIGYVDISSAGVVRPLSPSNNTWVSLDGISFRAA